MKLQYPIIFCLLGLVILSQSCQNNKDTRPYYFPVEELKEGKVYEYESVGNEYDPPFYWYYRSFEIEGSTYLTGMYYDHNFNPFQFIREEVVSNGMLLSDFYWYETDTLTGKQEQVNVDIESASVFPFTVKDPPSILVSSIHWQLPTDTLTKMTFIRNRQYEKDTSYVFKNNKIKSIQMNVRELIGNERVGHLEQEYAATEIYAWGLGLVYFEKDIAPEWQMKYRLKDIYDMETFEEKFKQTLGQ